MQREEEERRKRVKGLRIERGGEMRRDKEREVKFITLAHCIESLER